MSDKNKLSYYFKKRSTSSHETPDIHIITVQDVNTIDTDKSVEINESGSILSTSLSQSSASSSAYGAQDNNNINNKENTSTTKATANAITTTTATATANAITTNDLLTQSQLISPFKRHPARGPEHAREFILLGPYQSITTFPTINHRHFCLNWYKVYNWIEFSDMTKKAYCFVYRLPYSPGQCDNAFTKSGFNNW